MEEVHSENVLPLTPVLESNEISINSNILDEPSCSKISFIESQPSTSYEIFLLLKKWQKISNRDCKFLEAQVITSCTYREKLKLTD